LVKCEACGKELASDAALLQHQKDKHGGPQEPSGEPSGTKTKKAKKPGSLRKRNYHPVLLALVAISLVGGAGLYSVVSPQLAEPFPCIAGEGWVHIHPYLQIVIDGQTVTIPAAVGIANPIYQGSVVTSGSCYEPMHTHDASGIIHIELAQSDANDNFTLSDFFKVWSWTPGSVSFNGTSHPIVFTSTDILGYQADATHKVVMLVDGKPSTLYQNLPLEKYDYCDSTTSAPPCAPTAGASTPLWSGGNNYPYGTLHTIVIEYVST